MNPGCPLETVTLCVWLHRMFSKCCFVQTYHEYHPAPFMCVCERVTAVRHFGFHSQFVSVWWYCEYQQQSLVFMCCVCVCVVHHYRYFSLGDISHQQCVMIPSVSSWKIPPWKDYGMYFRWPLICPVNPLSDQKMSTLTCKVQFLNDVDPFSTFTKFPEPSRPPLFTFNVNIPLQNQVAAVHRLLGAPHRVRTIASVPLQSFS